MTQLTDNELYGQDFPHKHVHKCARCNTEFECVLNPCPIKEFKRILCTVCYYQEEENV